MRRDLNKNYGFYEVIVPTYSIDESHFRITRGTLDTLCRQRSGCNRNNSREKPLWKTTYTCPVPSVSIRLVYVKFGSPEIRLGQILT